MTIQTQVELSERVASHLGKGESLNGQFPAVIEARLAEVQTFGAAVGLSQEIAGMTYDQSVEAITKKIDGWQQLANSAPGAGLTIQALEEEAAKRLKVIRELRSVEAILDGKANPKQTESLLSVLGYKKYEDGSVEITMPKDGKIQELGKALNAEAKAGGISRPVFYEEQAEFWQKNEANQDLRTEPGKTYRFRIPSDSLNKNRNKQTKDYGSLPPLGAIALAEACERLRNKDEGSFFKIDGSSVWVRGATPGVSLRSHGDGVGVDDDDDGDGSHSDVACAESVPARN